MTAEAVSFEVLGRLREQTGDEDGELIRELIEVFSEDAIEACGRLQGLLQAGDTATLSREAHRLKSGAANLGAVGMTELCKELEAVAGRDEAEATAKRVHQLVQEVPRAIAGLESYLTTL